MKKPDFHAEFVEACMLASGYANMCGYHAAARTLAQYATCDKKALTAGGKDDTIKTTARQGMKQEGKTMKKYIVLRDGKPVLDRGSKIINAETPEAAIETAKALYADKIAGDGAYKYPYDYYYHIADNATYSAKQIA